MKGEENMGRILLATSNSTDEEYGGAIEQASSVTLTLNEPSGIVSSISGSALRDGKTVEVDIQLTLSNGASSDWVNLGSISKAPINNILINTSGDGHTTERVLRFNILSTGTIRIFHGASGTFNIHITYLCAD